MIVLMQCVAEAVASKGLRGLMEIVPGGGFLYDVAGDALRRLRDRKRIDELKDEVLQAATASFEDAKAAAEKVAREVAANSPREEQVALEMYLSQLPSAVRQSLKRTDDPSGRSVPANFALNEPADLLRRLPAKVPHFRPNDPLPGKPGWQLVELLGTGGFGEVWLARNPALSALKGAVKFGLDPQARDRLLRHEGTLVNRVMEHGKHPNVVTLLDAHLEGDAPWLMYEYVPGGDLTGLILLWQGLPIEERVNRTVAALATLASAVGHFHRLNPPLVHRDLKPANILVDSAERGTRNAESSNGPGDSSHSALRAPHSALKVADFGIGGAAAAASLAHERSRGSTGVLMSQLWGSYTPLYASPQQQAGNAPDPRDDVHALGVIGFQMLTGKLDATLGADYAKTLRRLNVPEPLIELLGDCAAHDPDNRPKDAAELAERLTTLTTRSVPNSDAPPRAEEMLLLTCPGCRAPMRIPAEVAGKRIKCSACQHIFTATPPASATVLSPEPPRDTRVSVACLKCGKTLRVQPTAVDEKVACTGCHYEFRVTPQGTARALAVRPTAKPVETRRERERDVDSEPKPRAKSRVWLFVLLAGLLGIVGLVVIGRFLLSGGSLPGPDIALPKVGPPPPPRPPEPAAQIEKHQEIQPPSGNRGRALRVAFLQGGTRVAVGYENDFTQVYSLDNRNNTEGLEDANGLRPAFSSDASRLVELTPSAMRLYRFNGGKITSTPLIGLDDTPALATFTSDDRWVLAGGSEKGWAKAWNVNAPDKPIALQDKLGVMSTHAGPITALTVDPKGRFAATAGEDDKVKVWEPNANWRFHTSLSTSTKPTALAFALDGKRLFVGLSDGTLRGWDADKNTEFLGKERKLGPIKQLVSGRTDRHVAGIDVTGGAWVYDQGLQGGPWEITGHGKVNSVAFAHRNERPEIDIMTSGGEDGTVQIWELFFNNVRAKLYAGGPVTALALSADGKRLAVGRADGTVLVWELAAVRRGLDAAVEVR